MKNIVKNSVFAFALSLVIVACGGESPKDATTNFYEALKKGDVATYHKYTTPNLTEICFYLLNVLIILYINYNAHSFNLQRPL